MSYIKEEHIQRSNIGRKEREEIKHKAKESAKFVINGGDPRDLPKALRSEIENR